MCILSLDSSTLPSASITPGKASRAEVISGGHRSVPTAAVRGKSSDGCCDTLLSSSSIACLPQKSGGKEVWESSHTSKPSFSAQPVEPGLFHPARPDDWQGKEKEKKAEENPRRTFLALFFLDLFRVHLTKSVNHMTGSPALGPAHQVERESPVPKFAVD